MSDAAIASAVPLHPDPDRAPSARLDAAGAGKILRLLRTLIAYGKNVVEKLREEDDPDDLPWYAYLTRIFGITDPAYITVVFIRGLLRATALQARLSRSLARGRNSLPPLPLQEGNEGLDLLPLPLREGAGVRGPGRGQSRGAGLAFPPGWPAGEPSHDREPSPEEEMFADIVAKDRDRPIGAILLDICLDLGIVPDLMDPATWEELRHAITLYGGDPTPLLAGIDSTNPTASTDVTDVTSVTGVGRKSEAHSATGTPGPTDSPPIPGAGQPIMVCPPWPAPSPAPASTGPP
jgi:hypothetical protein